MKDSTRNGDEGIGGRKEPVQRIGVEALFRAHAPFVAAFATRLGAAQSEVDDVVQEVFMVAHAKGGYEPGPALPRTWLAAIALRVTRSRQRSRARRREDTGDAPFDAMEASGQHPEGALDIAESLQRVQRALDSLELEHRAAFVLYEIEGESCQAIADALEVPIGTVYSRLHHARKRFVEAYAAQGEPTGVPMTPDRRLAEGA